MPKPIHSHYSIESYLIYGNALNDFLSANRADDRSDDFHLVPHKFPYPSQLAIVPGLKGANWIMMTGREETSTAIGLQAEFTMALSK